MRKIFSKNKVKLYFSILVPLTISTVVLKSSINEISYYSKSVLPKKESVIIQNAIENDIKVIKESMMDVTSQLDLSSDLPEADYLFIENILNQRAAQINGNDVVLLLNKDKELQSNLSKVSIDINSVTKSNLVNSMYSSTDKNKIYAGLMDLNNKLYAASYTRIYDSNNKTIGLILIANELTTPNHNQLFYDLGYNYLGNNNIFAVSNSTVLKDSDELYKDTVKQNSNAQELYIEDILDGDSIVLRVLNPLDSIVDNKKMMLIIGSIFAIGVISCFIGVKLLSL